MTTKISLDPDLVERAMEVSGELNEEATVR
jgi:hypothetical protein